jgi:hypothetical protein
MPFLIHYPPYRHTQTGWVIIGSFGAIFLVLSATMIATPLFPPWPVALTLGVTLLFFYKMTVTVEDRHILISLGIGLIGKRIDISQIGRAETAINRWWYGYGIRIGFGGIMYNVSGLRSVNLTMKDGYIYRIGTDDPEGLSGAINLRRRSG